MSNQIIVSGVGIPVLNAVAFPSGQFLPSEPGSQLAAYLVNVNATFGFNLTTHNFQLEFIPFGDPDTIYTASGQLPDIGHSLELLIGEFYINGNVTHADYTASAGGTTVNIVVEDNRFNLKRTKVHTEDLGENLPSGVVSIARTYRHLNGLVDINGDASNPLIREYKRILEFGGTYSQILDAINFHYNEGTSATPVTLLPTLEQIDQNVDGNEFDTLRFQFNLEQLDEAMTRVLQDTNYDWYWNMHTQKINIINKRIPFDLQESNILDLVGEFGSSSGLNETKQLGFGQDVVPDPTRFRVLGAHQEGFLNSALLSPIDGLETSALDGNLVFDKAWTNLAIGFYDADGFYRTYIPQEKELQLALAGIEQWSYYKKYQTNSATDFPPGYGLPPDNGSIAAQDPTFQSRLDPNMPIAGLATGLAESGLRVISNRRDEDNNWTLDFFSRVQDHSSRHYGRSYVCRGLLYNQASGLFDLTDTAWANVENQVQGYPLSPSGVVVTSGIYTDIYQINKALGPISPFISDDFRVSAHCVMPKDTIYGPLGDDVPASFANWTEDAPPFNPNGDGKHYIPITLTVVGQRVINPRSDDLYNFEVFPEGTLWCQLPINAGPSGGLINDNIIHNLATLVATNAKLTGSGLVDIINPAIFLNVYDALSGVAIPVQARTRYGQTYPSKWYLGELHYQRDEDIQLDDQFAPWAFYPMGNQTSLQVMTDRAIRRILGKIVPKSSSRYADFQQVGLPLLSFDSFAEQDIGPSGQYGEIAHGVNELNISFGSDGFSTHYKIQSYFPKFGQEAPLGDKQRALLDGILHPIDFTDLKLLNQDPGPGSNPSIPSNPFTPPFFFDTEQNAVKVQITEANNIFTLSSDPNTFTEERYRGKDKHNYIKPPAALDSSNPDFTQGAICIDGFLNINDFAIYHCDEFQLPGGNFVSRYFSQGRPFGNGLIVQIERNNTTTTSNYDVTIVDPTSAGNGIVRAIFNVPILNGTVNIGDKTTLASQGDASVKPGPTSNGIFLNGTTQAGAGVTPVGIISITHQGLINAKAVCRILNTDGQIVTSGTLFTDVVPIPYPQFATSGDKGFLTTASVPSGLFGASATVNFIEIVKPAFFRYQ